MIKHKRTAFSINHIFACAGLFVVLGFGLFITSPSAEAAVTKAQVDQTFNAKCDAFKKQTATTGSAKTVVQNICNRTPAKTASTSASNLYSLCGALDTYQKQNPSSGGTNLYKNVGIVYGGDCAKIRTPDSDVVALANQGNTGGEGSAPTAVCDIKVNKDRCVALIEKNCKGNFTANCARNVAKNLPNVVVECREQPNPQNCHRRVSQTCAGVPADKMKECREKAAANTEGNQDISLNSEYRDTAPKPCGEGEDAYMPQFDLGCQGKGNPIVDLSYSIIRFLSVGVGLVLAAAIIYAGILYSASSGNPEATSAAKQRIQNAVLALVFYLFIFAIIQYLVPGGLFN